ncbi:MAG: FHA domain-containing protein [Chloroflexi bacterium]|nr:FHA domain-containing protein [Chloroflexota bacterium]
MNLSTNVTTILPFSEFINHPPPPPISSEIVEIASESREMIIHIPSSRRRLKLQLHEEIRVGRGDSDLTPELDLTDDDGAEKGISRLHATIKSVKQGVVLIDLDSTNGTLLNTYRLPPQRPYPLKNGDEIRFGELLVHVFFE